ncbi:histidine kinase [Pseudoalteromonas luteoviolacea]|uniref:Histidine kinase n=1 Tax=Pseudoalteromonas luteoviolacea TaxID=43657 RepID=A0A1C0TVR8_9GAMM|nr:response regulator [Pseudoalteromonas luteoviolacea]MBQ4809935.1 hybrid sensor histidine kinase/response regulator [Pseudoalteromonas luteoviolacea]OCQ23418.1 histidine kinase [Pseudoalteromonas luteoviolacea]
MANILIVDDVAENLQILQLILRNEGHKVYAAISAEVALTIVGEHLPDLIISDIKMPHMNGLEFCRALKKVENTAQIPIIFVSAQSETDNIVAALEVGGVDYITKPFKPAEVIARVNTQLKLIEAHKLAVRQHLSHVMNQMVVGVAHEINTPLGTAITAVTHFDGILHELRSAFDGQTLSAEQLSDGLDDSLESAGLCERSLVRVAKFVKMLKEIAQVERPSNPREIEARGFFESLKERWQDEALQLEVRALTDTIIADDEVLSTVLDNLIANSLAHGKLAGSKPITIEIEKADQAIQIDYYDYGQGLQNLTVEELLKPFVTTKRGNAGHVGLSAAVTANLITNALHGSYQIFERGRGLEWVILIPLEAG